MRTSPSSRPARLPRLLLAASLALAAGTAWAEKADREKEIVVLADRIAGDDLKKEAVYEGNVVVTQGTMRITSARIVVREDGEGNRAYVATGSPVTFRQKRDKVDDWIDGSADRAEFEDRHELLKLFGHARVASSQGELVGEFITYDRGKETFEVTGAPPGKAAAPGSRVKATIIPQKKGADGKPVPRAPEAPATLTPAKGTGTGG